MNRIVKYVLITISIVGLFVAYGIFISAFDMFGELVNDISETNCDYEGLRQATAFEFGGNAVTIPSIIISIDLGCNRKPSLSKKKIMSSVEHRDGTKLETEWISFDTLKIIYSDRLEPITRIDKVTYSDSTLNVIIEYEKK